MTKSKWWVGQRVFGAGQGPGTVTNVVREMGNTHVHVKYEGQPCRYCYFDDGRYVLADLYPTLFPIDTERPKEKAKRRVEGWANFYQWNIKDVVAWGLHDSQAEADKVAIPARLGPACHVIHEWEEET